MQLQAESSEDTSDVSQHTEPAQESPLYGSHYITDDHRYLVSNKKIQDPQIPKTSPRRITPLKNLLVFAVFKKYNQSCLDGTKQINFEHNPPEEKIGDEEHNPFLKTWMKKRLKNHKPLQKTFYTSIQPINEKMQDLRCGIQYSESILRSIMIRCLQTKRQRTVKTGTRHLTMTRTTSRDDGNASPTSLTGAILFKNNSELQKHADFLPKLKQLKALDKENSRQEEIHPSGHVSFASQTQSVETSKIFDVSPEHNKVPILKNLRRSNLLKGTVRHASSNPNVMSVTFQASSSPLKTTARRIHHNQSIARIKMNNSESYLFHTMNRQVTDLVSKSGAFQTLASQQEDAQQNRTAAASRKIKIESGASMDLSILKHVLNSLQEKSAYLKQDMIYLQKYSEGYNPIYGGGDDDLECIKFCICHINCAFASIVEILLKSLQKYNEGLQMYDEEDSDTSSVDLNQDPFEKHKKTDKHKTNKLLNKQSQHDILGSLHSSILNQSQPSTSRLSSSQRNSQHFLDSARLIPDHKKHNSDFHIVQNSLIQDTDNQMSNQRLQYTPSSKSLSQCIRLYKQLNQKLARLTEQFMLAIMPTEQPLLQPAIGSFTKQNYLLFLDSSTKAKYYMSYCHYQATNLIKNTIQRACIFNQSAAKRQRRQGKTNESRSNLGIPNPHINSVHQTMEIINNTIIRKYKLQPPEFGAAMKQEKIKRISAIMGTGSHRIADNRREIMIKNKKDGTNVEESLKLLKIYHSLV